MDAVPAEKYSKEILPNFGVDAILSKDLEVLELWDDTQYVRFVGKNKKEYIFLTSDFLREDNVTTVVQESSRINKRNVIPLEYKKGCFRYRNTDFGIYCNFMVLEVF